MKEYDVFISHASEDKDSFVRDLANSLIQVGYKVWYDEFTLSVGDGLRRSIDLGINNSRFGIIVLSEYFFNKGWTNYELDGLTTIDIENSGIILPIWHNISRQKISFYSSSLANKVAINTNENSITEIIKQLEKKIGEYYYSVNIDGSVFRSEEKVSISSAQRNSGYQLIKSIQSDELFDKVKSVSRHDTTIYPYSMDLCEYNFNFHQKVKGDFQILRHVAYDIEKEKLLETENETIKNDGYYIVSVIKFKRISSGPIRIVCDLLSTNLFKPLFETGYDFMEFSHGSHIDLFSYTFMMPDSSDFRKIKLFADDLELKFKKTPNGLLVKHELKSVKVGTFTKYSLVDKSKKDL